MLPRKATDDTYQSPVSNLQIGMLSYHLGLNQKSTWGLVRKSILDGVPIDSVIQKMRSWFRYVPNLFANRFLVQCPYCRYLPPLLTPGKWIALTGDSSTPQILSGSGSAANPDVAYDPIRKHYLIVWDEAVSDGEKIFATLLESDGVTPVTGKEKILISTDRPTHGCLIPNFQQTTGLSAPIACNKNHHPQAAYNGGKFLIVWTLDEVAAAPQNFPFGVILGKMVDAATLQPASPGWQEGLLLSQVQYGSAVSEHAPTQDSEVQSWGLHQHPAVAPNLAGNNFLVAWETNEDYIGCITPNRWSSTSIYGRTVAPDFGPGQNNPQPFAIFTDPSVASPNGQTPLPACIPVQDVSIGKNPRVAYHGDLRKFLVVFESSKNIPNRKPSLGGEVVSLTNTGDPLLTDAHHVAPLLAKTNQGLFHPDVTPMNEQFAIAADVDNVDIIAATVDVASNSLLPTLATSKELDFGVGVQSHPRIVYAESQTTPELVLSFEQHAELNSTNSSINLTALDATLTPVRNQLSLVKDPLNKNQAIATSDDNVLVAWFTTNGSTENAIASAAAGISQIIPPTNQKPTALIGFTQGSSVVASGDRVILNADGSTDPEDGTELTYEWTQQSGPTITLSGTTQAHAEFIAPTVTTTKNIVILLRVKDTQGLASDLVSQTITLNPLAAHNTPPTARITIEGGQNPNNVPETANSAPYTPTEITLSGFTSDTGDPNQTLMYEWLQIDGGPDNSIRNPQVLDNGARFRFTAPDVIFPAAEQIVQIQLTVDDGQPNDHRSSPTILLLHFAYLNQPPTISVVAVQIMDEGTAKIISPVIADNDTAQTVNVVWTRIDSNPLALDWSQSGNDLSINPPAVTADTAVQFRVTATDSSNAGNHSDVALTIHNINHPPTAPVLQLPTDAGILPPTRALLQWEAATDADASEGDLISYDLLLDTVNPPVATQANCQGMQITHCILPNLLPNTPYFWKVIAKDSHQASSDSNIFSFQTDNSLTGRWLFNEGSGTTALDVSGNNHPGTFLIPRNTPTWLQNGDSFQSALVANVLDGAVGFSGDDYLHFNGVSLSSAAQQSIEIWFRADRIQSGEEYELYASRNNSDGFPQLYIPVYGTSGWVQCIYAPGSNVVLSSQAALPLHGLVHLVCQFGPGGMEMVLNGTRVDNKSNVISFGNNPGFSEMGYNSLEDVGYFTGVVDEVTIYNRPLSAAEITNSFSAHH